MITALVLALPRFVAGLLITGHGLQKLAGWFGGWRWLQIEAATA